LAPLDGGIGLSAKAAFEGLTRTPKFDIGT